MDKEYEEAKAFGRSIGHDVHLLKTLGADDGQIDCYIQFKGWSIRRREKPRLMIAYHVGVSQGNTATAAQELLTHPVYAQYRQYMRELLALNGYALSWADRRRWGD